MIGPTGLGVVIVAFNSADIIVECVESLLAGSVVPRIVVVDNASTDDTCAVLRDWASGTAPFAMPADSPLPRAGAVAKPVTLAEVAPGERSTAPVTLLRSPVNTGYAGGCNLGLSLLRDDPALGLFWIVNPDCVVAPDAAAAVLRGGADGNFALMGGRTLYYERPGEIQTDGGRVSRRTGVCRSVNAGGDPATAVAPDAATLDYITGAHLCASRRFVERVGLMHEDYFLYYEEVDWAFRRGDLPLRIVPEAVVYHRGGTAIGSGTSARRASAFANYFNYRNRRRFVARHLRGAAAGAAAYAVAKAAQSALRGERAEAAAILAGALERPPPAAIRHRVADAAAQALAFAPPGRR